ncbi:type IX secretion system protein PorG [Lacinutrix salivirga]
MRYLTIVLIIVFGFQFNYAQIHEIGGFLGGSNFIGDVGATDFVSPNQLAIGGIYKWNRSPRHSYRLSVSFTDLEGIDNKSDDPRRIQRDYKFNTQILEVAAGIEFTFFDFNLHDGGSKSTPYIFTGVSIASHDNFYFNSAGEITDENTSSFAFGIPIGLGYKTTVSNNLILGIEIAARYTFSDELDGSVPDSKANIDNFGFGNLNNNDWYVFSGITLTYTFGRNPCYCVY